MKTGNNNILGVLNESGIKRILILVTLLLFFAETGRAQLTADVTNSGPVCSGNPISLKETGTGATSWLWSTNGSATFNDNTLQDPIVNGAADGDTFTVVVEDDLGGIATAFTIVVVYPLPVVTLAAAGPYCINAVAVQLNGSPSGGTFSGPGVNASGLFTPSAANVGNHLITYTYSDVNSCSNSASISIIVNPLPSVTLAAAGPFCVNAAAVQLNGSPAGGTYSGTGVNATGLFTPSTAGTGSHVITYNYSDINGCANSATITINVNALPVVTLAAAGPFCVNSPAVQLNGLPTGGTYSGPGVNGTGFFTPSVAGTGSHVITYNYSDINGCVNSATITINVNPLPVVTLAAAGPFCVNSPAVQLNGMPAGGTYSGTGVNATGLFTPSAAGAGPHILTYTYLDINGCTNSATITVTVNPLPTVTMAAAGPFCINAAAVQLNGLPAGGTYSGTGVNATGLFTPSVAGTGPHVVTYTFSDINGCTNSASITITVNLLPIVTLAVAGPFCINTAAVQLNGSPAGGTYSGTGVNATGLFTPSTAGTGSHVITYNYSDINGCVNSAIITITVNPLPVVTLAAAGPFCVNSPAVQLNGMPAGGTYSGTGVNATGLFTPSTAGTGSRVITYTYSDLNSCSNSATTTIIVNPLPIVTLAAAGPFCINAAAIQLNGLPAGGTYSGTGVNATGLFTPSAAGAGQRVITYTYSDINGCTNSASITITVNPLPTVTLAAAGPFCINRAAVQLNGLPAGGTYTGNGVNGTGLFTPSVAGTGLHIITYTYSDVNGCTNSATISITVNPLPTVTLDAAGPLCINAVAVQLNGLPVGGTYSGTGVNATGLFTPSTAGTGSLVITYTYSDLNGCSNSATTTIIVNPSPTVTLAAAGPFCLDAAAVQLNGLPAGGTYTGTGVNATGLFTPSVAGAGQHVITYTYSDINGCPNSATITITVNPLPTVTLASAGPFCIDAAAVQLNGSPAGGTYSGTGVNGAGIFTPSTALTGLNVITYSYSDVNGCSSSASITINVNPLPAAGLTSSDADNIFCAGTSVTFTATGGTQYNFRIGGISVQNGTSPAYTTSALTNGQVVDVIVTSNEGCSSVSAGITNTVNALPVPGLVSSDADNIFCIGTSITFTATGGTLYNFTVGGISVQNGASSTYTTTTLTNGQVVNVIVTNAAICSATSASITNTVNQLPVPTLTSSDPDNIFCAGTSVTFTATGGNIYDFRIGGVSVQRSVSPTYTTSLLTNGQMVDVIATNASGCLASSPAITNFVNQLPFIIITVPPTCSVNLLTYSLAVGVSTGVVTSTSGIVTNSGGNIWTISGISAGVNTIVTVTDNNGCANSISITSPDCSCPVVLAPVSGGDKSYCSPGPIPSLTVTVFSGETSDWYNAASGGTLLLAGSLSYTPTVAGTYYAMTRNLSTACVSSTRTAVRAIMNALPVPSLTSSDTDNTFCTGTSITFTAGGGIIYNFRIGNTSVQNGTSATFTTSTLTNGQVVSVIVTNAAGCSATSGGITNTVNPIPVSNPGTGGNECDLDFRLNAVSGSGVGQWTLTSGPGTGIFTPNASRPNATVTVTTPGNYTFTWTEIAGNCSGTASIVVNFYRQPVANPGIGGNNCGLVFGLEAIPNIGTGTWSLTAGPGTATFSPVNFISDPTVTVSAFGQYTFTWTEVNEVCTDTGNIKVTFIESHVADGGNGGDECDLDFNFNAASGPGIGTWTKFSGPGNAAFSPSPNTPNARVTVDKPGTYEFAWTEVVIACQSTDMVTVTFHPLPSISAGRDTTICIGSSVSLRATGNGTYLWEPANLVNNPVIADPLATPTITTLFMITLTDQFGCINSDEVRVTVLSSPEPDAGPDQVLEYSFNTTMAAKIPSVGETAAWSLLTGKGIIAEASNPNSRVNGLSVGENLFLWTINNGKCPPVSDTVKVAVRDLQVPSLITPNMDGKNDFLVLRGIEILGKTELVIFNRWGAQVYKNQNYDNSWDGTDMNGDPLPDDTYFYVLKTANGKSLSSFIVIQR